MPDHLGLAPEAYLAMLGRHFPSARLPGRAPSGRRIDFARMLERDDLRRLLLGHAAQPARPEAAWLTDMLVAACMGCDHLWQDLGLWSRAELSALMALSFPTLAERNRRDMKWKKFIYKQLCESEGIYTCRAPSCEVCCDYAKCFGPED